MPEAEDRQRREQDLTVDKTMRITTTLGFFITVVLAVWFIGRWTDQIEDSSTAISAEIQALNVILEDVADRQSKYIDRNDAIHANDEDEDDELHDSIEGIREYLAAKYGEVLP